MEGRTDRQRTTASMRVVGDELRRLREARGLTQQALAHRVDVSRSHLCQVELGQTWPSADFLVRCESALGEPGRLIPLLRTAKVPTTTAPEANTHLDVTAHKFIPLRTPLEMTLTVSQSSVDLEDFGATHYVLPGSKIDSDLYVFPFGVAVLHQRELQRFPNIAHLAYWRQESHGSALAVAKEIVARHVTDASDLVPSHVLSVFEVLACPWSQPEDVQTGMRLLSVPSTLIDRRSERTFATVSKAEEAEQDVMRNGFDHPEIVDFGVRGISTAFASWSGVSYLAHSSSRALPFVDVVSWEVLVQALWCYCSGIVNDVHRDIAPTVHPDYGQRFLRRTTKRLSLAGAQEHLQARLMKDAILTTSRLPLLLDQA